MKFLKTFVKLKIPTIIEKSDFAKILNNSEFYENFVKIYKSRFPNLQ